MLTLNSCNMIIFRMVSYIKRKAALGEGVNVVLVHLNPVHLISSSAFLVRHQFNSWISRRYKITNFKRWKVNNDGMNQVCKMMDRSENAVTSCWRIKFPKYWWEIKKLWIFIDITKLQSVTNFTDQSISKQLHSI